MGWFKQAFSSSIGKKVVMALTGLFLCSFLTVHLIGNLALFRNDGGKAFNEYSHFMSTNPIIRILEIGMVLGFLFHIIEGVVLYFTNKMARPIQYARNDAAANSTFFSRFMIWSGSIVFIFLVVHLRSFFVEHRVIGSPLTMYQSVVEAFHSPVYAGFYVVAMVLLGFHLNHGFQSAFQTLGLNHKKYTPLIQGVGLVFSVLIPAGFAVMPVYFLFSM